MQELRDLIFVMRQLPAALRLYVDLMEHGNRARALGAKVLPTTLRVCLAAMVAVAREGDEARAFDPCSLDGRNCPPDHGHNR